MRELREYDDRDQMCGDAAQFIEECIVRRLREQNTFSLVLTGGELFQSLYRTLFYRDTLPWEKIHFFITDEMTPAEGEFESNFKSAVKTLLRRSNIPLQNIHWINTDILPLEKSALEYDRTLRSHLQDFGLFDLILLSLGPDGHVASLFPGFSELMEKESMAVLTEKAILDPRVPRITMTLPALNSSREILFFISDQNCASVLDEIMSRRPDDKFTYPAELVTGMEHRQIWFILRT